jgi:SNF2 family DNA or RNA helicase
MKNGRPLNILPLLQAIDHPIARDEWNFKMRYCAGHQKSFGKKTIWDFTGSAYLKELSDQLNDSILRRLKTEVAKELPGKTRIVRPVEEVSLFKQAIEKVVVDYKRRIVEIDKEDPAKAESLRNAEALVTLGKFRETSSHFKMQEAVELAKELLACNQQVVLFTEFNATANFLHEKLGGELLDGKTKDRQDAVDRFQSGESKVFVSTIRAGGVGITLTAASETIMVDRPWTPGDLEQAEDRTNRIGQTNMCFIYWLQLGDIDRLIDELLHQKAERIELMMKGKRKTLRGVKSPLELAKALLEELIK